jgi:hypothetical protein
VQSFHATLAATAGARTGGAGAYYLSATKTGNDWNTWKEQSLTVIAGQVYRYSFWAKISTGTPTIRFILKNGGTNYSSISSHVLSTSWQQFTGTMTVLTSGTVNRINFDCPAQGTNGDIYDIDDVELRLQGPIFKPVIQPGVVIDDTGSNGIAGILTAGISPITDRTEARIRGTTNTSGNQLLLGAGVLPDGYLVSIRARARTGTPTVKWGAVSAGAEWVAAIALNGNWKELTMVNPSQNGASLGNVWVNSTTADIIDTCIQIRRLN